MPVKFLNGTESQKADFDAAMSYLGSTEVGKTLVWKLATTEVLISFNHVGKNEYLPSQNIISWDSRAALNIINANGIIEANSAAIVLAHEMQHWLLRFSTSSLDEAWAVDFANRIAAELGEPIRPNYNSIYGSNPYIQTDSTTSHTQYGYWRKVEDGIKEFGPLYNPAVKVITETGDGVPPQPPVSGGGDGGESGGGGAPPSNGGGSSSGGAGGGGTGVVIVEPVPPPDENPNVVIDPHPYSLVQEPDQIGIVGVPDAIL